MRIHFPSLVLLSLAACTDKRDNDSGFMPSINFELPENTLAETGSGLAGEDFSVAAAGAGFNVLANWGVRTSQAIERVNRISARLNTKLNVVGAFTMDGEGGTLNGIAADVTDDPDFARQAIVCANKKPLFFAQWSTNKKKVRIVRDHSVDALGIGSATGLVTDMFLDASELQFTALTVRSYGVPWKVPPDVSADTARGGTRLGEYAYATRTSTGLFSLAAVNAWESAARTADNEAAAFEGDAWFTGKMYTNGVGSFLAYRRWSFDCATGVFNQSFDAPNWCFAGAVTEDNAVSYSQDANLRLNLWTSTGLQPIGVAQASSIKVVKMPTTLSCP